MGDFYLDENIKPAIKISNLSLRLNGEKILDDVSLSVKRGELLCVIGVNGAGKSTLLKCICGIHNAYSGAVEIDGVPRSVMNARELARSVAYVPQSSPDDVPYTVREFVEMSRYPWKNVASAASDERAVSRALCLTETEELADRPMASLSGGERQRASIASAIAQDSGIVLMDEPTTYLDYKHQAETTRLMKHINERLGTTIVAVTHDVNMAADISTSVIAMSRGRIEWSGAPEALFEGTRLGEIFGVDFESYYSADPSKHPVAVVRREHGQGAALA